MGDFRKYACDISGELFKAINKKGVRRERLALEMGISVNQVKNYAYDSSKSATLENFLYAITQYKCVDVLNTIAKDMDCIVCRLPEVRSGANDASAAAEAIADVGRAVSAYMDQNVSDSETEQLMRRAIERLVMLSKSL